VTLENFFRENQKVVLGFSGGVDSSFLLYAGLTCGAEISACFVKSAFQPEFELQDALLLAEHIGAKAVVIDKNILNDARVTANNNDRCYYCKMSIIGTLRLYAAAVKAPLIIDGTTASDDVSDRPGMRALAENGVRSPLRECGLTKDDVRRLSRSAGLFTWNKPAYACLATRVSTGITITGELLQRIEKAEDALSRFGFRDFRVRVIAENCRGCRSWPPVYEEVAKLQFLADQMDYAADWREDIVKAVKPYFRRVLLDMEGRA
jgi:uncharacterized protein